MLIKNLKPLDTSLRKIQEIPEMFFRNIETAQKFDNKLFPNWLFDSRGNSIIFNNQTVLLSNFKAIYDKYKAIQDTNERGKIVDAFTNSNQIEKLCNHDVSVKSFELNDLDINVRKEIDDTFLYLYNSAIKHPPFVRLVDDDLDKAIRRFIKENNIEICPFCGLETMIQITGQARISLDHWLNKDRFPFSSVNFDNLTPIGTGCNDRAVKGTKNVLQDRGQKNRVRAFYPFATNQGVSVKFQFINEPLIEGINDCDWEIDIAPNDSTEQEIFSSWEYIFNVSTRYKEYLKEYTLKDWQKDYHAFIQVDNDDMEHAKTITELKENLRKWKKAFPIQKRHGSIIYRAFIDYLINQASDEYLFGLCENFKSWERNSYYDMSFI